MKQMKKIGEQLSAIRSTRNRARMPKPQAFRDRKHDYSRASRKAETRREIADCKIAQK